MSSNAILRLAEELAQASALADQAREHEAAVAVDARGALHAAVGVVAGQPRALVALGVSGIARTLPSRWKLQAWYEHTNALPVLPFWLPHQLHAAVRAAVVQHLHAAVACRAPSPSAGGRSAPRGSRRRSAPATRGRSRPRCVPRSAPSPGRRSPGRCRPLVHAVGFDERLQVHRRILGLGQSTDSLCDECMPPRHTAEPDTVLRGRAHDAFRPRRRCSSTRPAACRGHIRRIAASGSRGPGCGIRGRRRTRP